MAESAGRQAASMLLVGVLAGVGVMMLLPRSDSTETTEVETPVEVAVSSEGAAPAESSDLPDAVDAAPAVPGGEFVSADELSTQLPPSVVRVLVSEQAVLYVDESQEQKDGP